MREFYKDFAPDGAWPQPRCGWEFFADDDPGWLVPRNPGHWDGIPLGFLEAIHAAATAGHPARDGDGEIVRAGISTASRRVSATLAAIAVLQLLKKAQAFG